jgi:hypothetical protein
VSGKRADTSCCRSLEYQGFTSCRRQKIENSEKFHKIRIFPIDNSSNVEYNVPHQANGDYPNHESVPVFSRFA